MVVNFDIFPSWIRENLDRIGDETVSVHCRDLVNLVILVNLMILVNLVILVVTVSYIFDILELPAFRKYIM